MRKEEIFLFLHRLKNKEWNWIQLFDYTSMVGALKHKSVLSSKMKFSSSSLSFMRIRTFALKGDNERKIHRENVAKGRVRQRKNFLCDIDWFFVHNVLMMMFLLSLWWHNWQTKLFLGKKNFVVEFFLLFLHVTKKQYFSLKLKYFQNQI